MITKRQRLIVLVAVRLTERGAVRLDLSGEDLDTRIEEITTDLGEQQPVTYWWIQPTMDHIYSTSRRRQLFLSAVCRHWLATH